MEIMIAKIMRRYGQKLLLCRGNTETAVFAFFQSDTGKVDRLTRLHPGPLGLENRRRYIYLGPVQPQPQQGDTLKLGQQEFVVQTAQTVFGAEQPAYVWAMCVEKGGVSSWDRNG